MQTLRDRISRLSYEKAASLLGLNGKHLIKVGAKSQIDLDTDVEITKNVFRIKVEDALVSVIDDDRSVNKMRVICSICNHLNCEHKGAAFAMLLDSKTPLGLAKPPAEDLASGELSDDELVMREIARREDRAATERMSIQASDPKTPWSEYVVTSTESGRTYRVDLRGLERGQSFCSCPDYRKNTLGTCKHIMKVLQTAQKKFSANTLKKPHILTDVEIYIHYGTHQELRVAVPDTEDSAIASVFKKYRNKEVKSVVDLLGSIKEAAKQGYEPVIFPDAEEFITQNLSLQKMTTVVNDIRKDPLSHPLRKSLLKVELLPYQLDGIAFIAGTGRAVLADDMGLGKTIQAIGAAELLSRHCDISKVLIICPTSLKSQWGNEIRKFCDRTYQHILGSAAERKKQYDNECFFTICNYEQVMRDLMWIEPVKWDFIILDEGQRIKNWAAKTSQMIKALHSRFALVLSGTPLENKIDELYSVVEFINERQLGPAFRFYNFHKIVDDRGKALGYKNLDTLRKNLAGVLLRRTRDTVMQELPPKTTEIIRIVPTQEQFEINEANMKIARQIAAKPYLTEMDLLRLQKALLLARMSADSTFLVDKKQPSYSSKLEYLGELLPRLLEEQGRKIILFSEWTTMLDCIEEILKPLNVDYVRLDGSVVQKKRQMLVNQFQNNPDCRLFMTTNAGSTGLNLQSANTVINVDLPWNPAILDQRIGRAHRMGQLRPVHVYLLVTEATIEERMLSTLSNKKDLALAALDASSDVTAVEMTSSIDDIKSKLEILLGEKAPAPVDESMLDAVTEEKPPEPARANERASEASGKLLSAVFSFIQESLPQAAQPEKTESPLALALQESFKSISKATPEGKVKMELTFDSQDAINSLGSTIAMLLEASGKKFG